MKKHPYLKQTLVKPLVLSIHLAITTGLVFSSQSSIAADTVQTNNYKIPANSLNLVLNQFAAQSGVAIAMDAKQLATIRSEGLNGNYSIADGFARILQDTNFQVQKNSTGYVIVEKAKTQVRDMGQLNPIDVNARTISSRVGTAKSEVAQLPVITVNADQNTTEGTGSYTTGKMQTATKLNLSIKETPQSVSILTRSQIDDLGLTTLDDAVQNVTGLVMQKGYYQGESGSFSARGFAISNINVDGLTLDTGANGTFNADNDSLDIYDHVEVVRGATGLTTGSGTPSATINLVRKRPTTETQGAVSLSAGSWNNYRASVDVGGALNTDKTIRARTVIAAQDSEQFYDNADARNYQLYGIIEADIAANLMGTLGIHYRKVDNNGGTQNLPNHVDGSFFNISRKTNLSNDFDFWKQEDLTIFSDLTYTFANDWKLKFAGNWKRPEQDILFSTQTGSGSLYSNNPVDGSPFYQSTQHYKLDNKADSYELTLNGDYTLFNKTHELILGANSRERYNKNWGGWSADSWTTNAPVVNPYHWDSSSISRPDIDMTRWNIKTKTKQTGLYAATRLSVSDSLKFILGSRFNWYESDNLIANRSYDEKGEITPYAGVVFDLNPQHSLYASWTEIFEPQSDIDLNGNQLKPITGTNYELGLKGEYFDGRLNTSLATFLIEQQNRAVDDLSSLNPCPGSAYGYCKRASGEVESKGFETEISGALTDHWQLTAGYTYVKTKYTKDVDTNIIGTIFNPSLPRQQFKLSTSYRLPAQWEKWRIGGSVYAQTVTQATDNELIKQGGYTLLSLNGSYQVNPNVNVQLNINNLFDKTYYIGLGYGSAGTTYGIPRNIVATLNYRF
ncbi:TonB-dependent siderophore receptor [Acinetobacter populi]|nr:TonB-dependent receptor [Acinetobacter populi]